MISSVVLMNTSRIKKREKFLKDKKTRMQLHSGFLEI